MPKQTYETTNDDSKLAERLKLAAKVAGATVVAAVVGVAYNNSRDYGYHPDRNPSPPTYLETHSGIDPADIIHNDSK